LAGSDATCPEYTASERDFRGPSARRDVSLERRFGVGIVALGVGQSALAAATLLGPDSDPLTGWTTAALALGSFVLGGLILTERMPLDITDGQRRLLGFIANASVVGGIAGTLVGVLLLAGPLLG